MYSVLFAILTMVMPPCEYEDTMNCYWDGGNNEGMPFIDIDGQPIYEVR